MQVEKITVMTITGEESVEAIYRKCGLAVIADSAGYRIFDISIMRAINGKYYKTVFFAKRKLKKIVKKRIKDRKRFVESAFKYNKK